MPPHIHLDLVYKRANKQNSNAALHWPLIGTTNSQIQTWRRVVASSKYYKIHTRLREAAALVLDSASTDVISAAGHYLQVEMHFFMVR